MGCSFTAMGFSRSKKRPSTSGLTPTFTESNSDSTWAFKPRCFFPSPLQQLSSRWWDDQRCVGIKTPENSDFLKKKNTTPIFFFDWPRCAHGVFLKNLYQPLLVFLEANKTKNHQATPVLSMIDTQSPEPWVFIP